MYYSLRFICILLHPIYNKVTMCLFFGGRICKIRKTSFLSPAREKNEVFRIIGYMYEQEYATVSAFLYI